MTGQNLFACLQSVKGSTLNERSVGWGISQWSEQPDDVAMLTYVGPKRSGMTIQGAIDLLLDVMEQRSTVDTFIRFLDRHSVEMTAGGDFILRRLAPTAQA